MILKLLEEVKILAICFHILSTALFANGVGEISGSKSCPFLIFQFKNQCRRLSYSQTVKIIATNLKVEKKNKLKINKSQEQFIL